MIHSRYVDVLMRFGVVDPSADTARQSVSTNGHIQPFSLFAPFEGSAREGGGGSLLHSPDISPTTSATGEGASEMTMPSMEPNPLYTKLPKEDSRGKASIAGGLSRGTSQMPRSRRVPALQREDLEQLSKAQLVDMLLNVHSLFAPPTTPMVGLDALSASTRSESVAPGIDLQRQSTVFTSNLEKGYTDDGFKFINKFLVLEELGRGSFGKVKLAVDTTNNDEYVAIKIIGRAQLQQKFVIEQLLSPTTEKPRKGSNASDDGEDDPMGMLSLSRGAHDMDFDIKLLQEVAIMKKLKHPNIVRLKEVIDDPESAKLYFVMQYIERGPLLRMDENNSCRPLDNDIARSYMKQLCSAVHYLHRRKIVHRDIKPDNILLGDNGRVYLSDFGVSALLENVELADSQGTPAFMAPELLRGDRDYDGPATDIWSLGVTFFVMLYGELPFSGTNRADLRASIETTIVAEHPKVLETSFKSAESSVLSRVESGMDFNDSADSLSALSGMVIGMLQTDAANRWTISQCQRHLRGGISRNTSNLKRATSQMSPEAKSNGKSTDSKAAEENGEGEDRSGLTPSEGEKDTPKTPAPPASGSGNSPRKQGLQASNSTLPSIEVGKDEKPKLEVQPLDPNVIASDGCDKVDLSTAEVNGAIVAQQMLGVDRSDIIRRLSQKKPHLLVRSRRSSYYEGE